MSGEITIDGVRYERHDECDGYGCDDCDEGWVEIGDKDGQTEPIVSNPPASETLAAPEFSRIPCVQYMGVDGVWHTLRVVALPPERERQAYLDRLANRLTQNAGRPLLRWGAQAEPVMLE